MQHVQKLYLQQLQVSSCDQNPSIAAPNVKPAVFAVISHFQHAKPARLYKRRRPNLLYFFAGDGNDRGEQKRQAFLDTSVAAKEHMGAGED